MIALLAHFVAAFIDLLRKGNLEEATKQRPAEETAIEETPENAELVLKASLFSGYNDFVTEKLGEFVHRLSTIESKVPNTTDTDVLAGAIGLLEKSFDSLKQQLEYGDNPARGCQQSATEMDRRITVLRRKTESILTKAAGLKTDMQQISSDFAPLREKWANVKEKLLVVAQQHSNEAAQESTGN